MKKLLYVTHLSGRRLNRFWMSSIMAAHELGYEFHLACNMEEAEHPIWDRECEENSVITHQIDFNRNPLHPRNLGAAKQLIRLMREEGFDIVHCNTPVGGVIGRICAKKTRVSQIIYQAHGFHFWKGAPIKNWIIYYPIERWLAHKTDVIILINREDYERAKTFKAKDIVFVPGVGVDTNFFSQGIERKEEIREELGIPLGATVLLSVGEIIMRKNHRIVFKVLPGLKDTWYVICGQGLLYDEYTEMTKKLGIRDRVILTGYRTDVNYFYNMADVFVLPSYQEGLSVALMEAMASGLPCIVSDIRGNRDLIEDKEWRFDPYDKEQLRSVLLKIINDEDKKKLLGSINKEKIEDYCTEIVVEELKKIYTGSE